MTILSPTETIRYWQLKESNRVIATPCQMTPRWSEINQDQFQQLVILRKPVVAEEKEES